VQGCTGLSADGPANRCAVPEPLTVQLVAEIPSMAHSVPCWALCMSAQQATHEHAAAPADWCACR
jgi:hypothetical protein